MENLNSKTDTAQIRQYMFGFVGNPAPGEVEFWGQHMLSEKSGHFALMVTTSALYTAIFSG